MNDHTRSPFDNGGQKATIQSDGAEQVLVNGLLPEFIGNGDEAAARCRRSAYVVDDNINPPKAAQNLADDFRRAFKS